MIFTEIRFHNFRVFKGRQEIPLLAAPGKPVCLIGGLNGAGKTTILEGMQLVLYGSRAPYLDGLSGGYESYLRGSINRRVKPSEGASVELIFEKEEAGQPREYRVARYWSPHGKSIQESLYVFVDGKQDRLLTDTWPQQVENFIPARLSELFFFDGERIEDLADPDRSQKIFATALDALLGMDLVRQLALDLEVLERRKRRETSPAEDRARLESIEARLADDEMILDKLCSQREDSKHRVDALDAELRVLDARFAERGGLLLENRMAMENELTAAQASLEQTRAALVEVAAGPLPFLMVLDLLQSLLHQTGIEHAALQASLVEAALADYERGLLAELMELDVGEGILSRVRSFGASIRDGGERVEPYLNMTERASRLLQNLLDAGLDEVSLQARSLLEESAELRDSVDELERKLAAVPEEECLAELISERKRVRRELEVGRKTYADLEEQVSVAEGIRERTRTGLEAELEKLRDATRKDREVERLITYSRRARGSLQRFAEAAIRMRAEHLESLVLESFLKLLHKSSLVGRIEIDPKTCELRLYDQRSNPLSADALSKGERQLLAVAILWALADASGRALPVVADTPLGRLDSLHRQHLVSRYFPVASHQVILLSTDKEIDQTLYARLQPWLGRTYRLDYDDETASTVPVPGYFTKDEV